MRRLCTTACTVGVLGGITLAPAMNVLADNEPGALYDNELSYEEEDCLAGVPSEKLIPPVDLCWEAPGKIAYRVMTTETIPYTIEVYKNGVRVGGGTHQGGEIDADGFYHSVAPTTCFEGSGTYSFKVYVGSSAEKVYAQEAPEIEWEQPKERIATPANVRWLKENDKVYTVCDAVEHASAYEYTFYQNEEKVGVRVTSQNQADWVNNNGIYEQGGTFTVKACSNDLTAYANSLVSQKAENIKSDPSDKPDGLYQDANADYYYYRNGRVATEMNGYVDYAGSKFYLTYGKVDTSVNGVKIDAAAHPLVWYFCANGQVQTQHKGLAEYDGAWFYVENGKVAVDMNAFVAYDGGLFAVGAGRVINEYSGLMQDPQNPQTGDWYFFANGQAQTQYTGLAQYDGAWFYITEGKLADGYTGNVDYDGATFYVENGMVK